MTPRDYFRAYMKERRDYKPGHPEHDWRTRACRKYVWIMRGVPSLKWASLEKEHAKPASD